MRGLSDDMLQSALPSPAAVSVVLAAALAVGLYLNLERTPAPTRVVAKSEPQSVTPATGIPPWLFEERGDLADLRARGTLRVLTVGPQHATCRPDASRRHEARMLRHFAREQGIGVQWVCVERHRDLTKYLHDGRGDVIAGYRAGGQRAAAVVASTLPFALAEEVLVSRAGDQRVSALDDLAGREVAVRPTASALAELRRAQQRQKGLTLRFLPDDLDAATILRRIEAGELDTAVLSMAATEGLAQRNPGVRRAFVIGSPRTVAWGVREDSTELLEALDTFLRVAHLAHEPPLAYRADLAEIKQRRVLRVLARPHELGYFIARGAVLGFEYELVRRFANRNGLHLSVVVPPPGEDLTEWLRAGKADLLAMPLSPGALAGERGLSATRPYRYADVTVVGASGKPGLSGPAALAGRSVVVPAESPYRDILDVLRADGVDVRVVDAPTGTDTAELLAAVAAGEYDYTLTDAQLLASLLKVRKGVAAALTLDAERPLRWAVRDDQPELRAALDEFVRGEFRGKFYNVVYRKYFHNSRMVGRYLAWRRAGGDHLSPFDAPLREFAARYEFDWRLIAAQMYQESRFNPNAESEKGARGLLQLMPRTAPEVGLDEVGIDPRSDIHAGIKYLARLRARFDEQLPLMERTWFALAAYNAGYARVQAARALATRMGLNRDRWFGNVEKAMLALPRENRVAHGSCRCTEPVRYVREIHSRYAAYRGLSEPLRLSAAPRTNGNRPG